MSRARQRRAETLTGPVASSSSAGWRNSRDSDVERAVLRRKCSTCGALTLVRVRRLRTVAHTGFVDLVAKSPAQLGEEQHDLLLLLRRPIRADEGG